MKCRNGPAAVIGDDRCICHCLFINRWEGAAIRMILESEDLPEYIYGEPHVVLGLGSRLKKGIPRIDTRIDPGFLFG